MPDPHKDLADIIEPALGAAPAAETSLALPLVLVLVGVLLALGIRGIWRRRAPLRALRRLADETDPQVGADRLAQLMTDRAAPGNWRQDLERLRFGPPTADAGATLARLCREAEAVLKPRR